MIPQARGKISTKLRDLQTRVERLKPRVSPGTYYTDSTHGMMRRAAVSKQAAVSDTDEGRWA